MKLRITVNGKVYEVEVEVLEHDRLQHRQVAPAVQTSAAAPVVASTPAAVPASSAATAGSADESKVFRCPMPGVVVRVPVQVGQSVKVNDELMVLEAMKMETVIASKCEGKISKINANVGDSVQAEQVLVEFE